MTHFAAVAAASCDSLLTVCGESVTYKPSGGSDRAISAIIVRNPPEQVDNPGGRTRANKLSIRVKNNATDGIASTEIDTGGDRINVAPRYGGTAVEMTFRLVSHDPAWVVLEAVG